MADDYHVKKMSLDQLDAVASDWRSKLGCSDEWVPNVLDLLIGAGRLSAGPTSGLQIEFASMNELGSTEARAEPAARRIVFREDLRDSLVRGEPRARWTGCHELFHIILHPGLAKERNSLGYARQSFVRPETSAERQADACSSRFLMPTKLAIHCGSAEDIARRMNVSLQAAQFRWNELEKTVRPRETPYSVQREIEKLKSMNGVDRRSPTRSFLTADQNMKILWEVAPELPGNDPKEYRLIAGMYAIRKSRLNQERAGGWRIVNDKIVAWESGQ